MVAFRKMFPVLAIGAFLIGTATTASAQGPLICNTNAGVPPVVRAEGFTELVGDIVIECTGGNPNQAFTANFQLFLNTNITSRLIGGGLSEALLMIDDPGNERLNRQGGVGTATPFCLSPLSGTGQQPTASNSAPAVTTGEGGTVSQVAGLPVGGLFGNGTGPNTCNPGLAGGGGADPTQTFQQGTYTVFRGQAARAANNTENAAVVWAGIPIVPPGSNNTRTFRITNVRANAAASPASASLVPTQITAFISISGSQSLALNNPQQIVAFVLPGLQFDVRSCAGGGGSPFTFLQCNNQNADLFNNPSAGGPFGANFGVRFREGFQTSFKTRIQGVDPGGQFTSFPGVVYNTESGFVRPELGASVGQATTGTRLAARFTNVPEGVRLFVSTTNVIGNNEIGTGTASAVLVSTLDQSGSGGAVVGSTTTLSCGTLPASAAAEVPLSGTGTGRAGIAIWEVTDANSAAIDTLFFYVSVAYAANTPNNLPGLGQSSVTGSFAPFYAANSAAASASATLPIPRFIDNATPRADFVINQCVSNLLFPFVTNREGFDTGIAISNTSRDPFGGNAGRLQSGTCTLNYYGSTPGGPAPPADTTDGPVEAGGQLLFVLSTGGANGVDAVPGFQGYIIAQCRFQYAHGFAFVTDGPIGQARVAEGYLALVMDAGIGTRTGSFSEVLSH